MMVVVVVVDLIDQSRFFIRAVIGFTISKAVLIGKKVAINFFGLFL